MSRIAGARVDVLRRAFAASGREGIWRAQLASLGTQGLPFERAVWHAQLGENDAAFRELERAYTTHVIWLPYLNAESFFPTTFRHDPRFRSLLRRLRLPESANQDGPVTSERGS